MPNDTTPPAPAESRLARFLDASDRPLLLLAMVAVGLYMAELRGLLPEGHWLQGVAVAIDFVFVIDVALKLAVQGRAYVTSAWFLIDVLSCLPAFAHVQHLPAFDGVRFIRMFRALRVLRTVRLLRAFHALPVFQRYVREAGDSQEGKRFRVAMNVGVVAYSLAFLLVLSWMRATVADDYKAEVASLLAGENSVADVASVGGSLTMPAKRAFSIPVRVDGAERPVWFLEASVTTRAAHLELLLILGSLAATFLMVFLIHNLLHDVSFGQLRMLLNLALPEQVAQYFLSHPEAYHDRHRGQATVVFLDIVGFTKTVEARGADVDGVAASLERVMDKAVDALVKEDLIIDKFIGDAVMAFRGGPLVSGDPAEHAARVVRASLAAKRAVAAAKDPYFKAVKVGGASAEVMIGAFGTSRRLSYTVLGDGVNLAARLEPASGQCAAESLFCDETRKRCGDQPGILWRRWGTIRVKGKHEPQVVWEALHPDDHPSRTFIATYEAARRAFEARKFVDARRLFVDADSQRPGGDPPSQLHLGWCDTLHAQCPDDWDAAAVVAK